LHAEHVRLALEAGKPVLCEKAFTLDAADAEELVALARDRQLFLMEAMWMRCNPLVRRLQRMHREGRLGEVRQVRADLGFRVDAPSTDRLLDPALGGGVLLDMGIYPLTFAHLFLGDPTTVAAAASLSPAGSDLDLSLSLGYASGAIASLSATMTAWSPRTASIATDLGRVDIAAPFHHPTSAIWTTVAGSEPITEARTGTGLADEAREVVRCLRAGENESPLVPLEETVALLRLMDRIRAQIGVVYPGEASVR
ncbi:MAG: Gfo/Idh/MocA family protein, partial [Nocardioidaceae bacterium]